MTDFVIDMYRIDLPDETRCHTICGEELVERTKKFIRGRIAQENAKFGRGFNPWKLRVRTLEEANC